MEEIMPYIASIACSAVSGLVSYCVAKKNCEVELKKLRESNEHDIDRLVKSHEADIESLKEKHKLEMEKLEMKHRHALELATNSTQNEVAGQIVSLLLGSVASSPTIKEQIEKQIQESMKR